MVQKEVAAVLGIDHRVYSNYETGKREIPVKHLIRRAEFYGVSVDFILGCPTRQSHICELQNNAPAPEAQEH